MKNECLSLPFKNTLMKKIFRHIILGQSKQKFLNIKPTKEEIKIFDISATRTGRESWRGKCITKINYIGIDSSLEQWSWTDEYM